MRLIDDIKLNALFEDAQSSVRKRSHLLLHSDHNEKVQRLVIVLVKGSYVEPHYHELPHQWEMFVVSEGCVQITLYTAEGEVQSTFLAGPGTDTAIVEFSPGDIHSVECMSERAVMIEVKEGPFDPQFAKASPDWA
ncbi:WbuC family cupin fold metalloprotein [Enterobacter sp. CC120223-11]|uniref:WbuC family cupin fold metalloprotein n=1 Tax=Enterobacter sp. CC120223-11 TaxID=1378073 RepID=UPI000BC911C6|nr:WbuC family cupin fold metalloprotein [Enterobacter sp. CC120223-11]SNY64200.1 cupin fold metalloprotein, WbuC family [Enterobacter sp. CC120223-11]